MTFRLYSNDMQDGGRLANAQVFNAFGHNGENRSPHLAWEGVPEGTKSLALTVYDPDAPTGSGLWHWIVVDIPPTATEIPAGAGSGGAALPAGARATRNDAGTTEYLGAAPPPGPAHRYVFTLYALSAEKLDVNEDTSGAMVGFNITMTKLGEAKLTATYGV